MLNQHHADRRQLAYLVTTEPATLTALVHRELAAATTARLRVVGDDLIDLILGRVFASRTQVSILGAGLALGIAPPSQQLLGLQASLRTPLLT